MAAKFSVFKDKAGKYRFNLIIAESKSYPDKKSALKGIASIQKDIAIAKISDDTGEAEIFKKPGRKPAGEKTAKETAPKKRGPKLYKSDTC